MYSIPKSYKKYGMESYFIFDPSQKSYIYKSSKRGKELSKLYDLQKNFVLDYRDLDFVSDKSIKGKESLKWYNMHAVNPVLLDEYTANADKKDLRKLVNMIKFHPLMENKYEKEKYISKKSIKYQASPIINDNTISTDLDIFISSLDENLKKQLREKYKNEKLIKLPSPLSVPLFKSKNFNSIKMENKFINYLYKRFDDKLCFFSHQNRIGFFWINEELYFYPELLEICKEQDKRFILIPLSLMGDFFNHQNVILIDLKNKTYERFDPWGSMTSEQYEPEKLDKVLQEFFEEQLPGFRFITPHELCPTGKSFQTIQSNVYEFSPDTTEKIKKRYKTENIGFCVAWSMFYVYMRLKNPDIKPSELQYQTLLYFVNNDIHMGHYIIKFIDNVASSFD